MPVQTLPLLADLVRGGATVRLHEATGYGPDLEYSVDALSLGDRDTASSAHNPLAVNSDGTPATSTERWLRIQFAPPFTRISRLRFWCPNLALGNGWTLYWGTTASFRKPTRHASDIATEDLPTGDPGRALLTVPAATDSATSDWLVLQASCTGIPGPMQEPPPRLRFAWTQV